MSTEAAPEGRRRFEAGATAPVATNEDVVPVSTLLRMAAKKVVLVNAAEPLPNLSFLI